MIQSFSSAAIGACLLGTLTVNELTGYNALELSGWNLGCAIDPTCRKLTDTEVNFAQKYFGDTVDYSTINYFERGPIWALQRQFNILVGSDTTLATQTFGNIYEGKYSLYDHETDIILNPTTFGHEMMHVWQHQNLSTIEQVRIVINKTRQYDIDRADDNLRFLNFYSEQQAEIFETMIRLQLRLESIKGTGGTVSPDLCKNLNNHETLVRQILPIEITQCSPEPLST